VVVRFSGVLAHRMSEVRRVMNQGIEGYTYLE